MTVNWDKKISALKLWGTILGGVFVLTEIFSGHLFSGNSPFSENLLLALFAFLLPPLTIFLFYWPCERADSDETKIPCARWPKKKKAILVIVGIIIAYKIVMSLYIGHKTSELEQGLINLQKTHPEYFRDYLW